MLGHSDTDQTCKAMHMKTPLLSLKGWLYMASTAGCNQGSVHQTMSWPYLSFNLLLSSHPPPHSNLSDDTNGVHGMGNRARETGNWVFCTREPPFCPIPYVWSMSDIRLLTHWFTVCPHTARPVLNSAQHCQETLQFSLPSSHAEHKRGTKIPSLPGVQDDCTGFSTHHWWNKCTWSSYFLDVTKS